MKPFETLMDDASRMTDAQLKSFTKGVALISAYISGDFIGEKGDANLVVSAEDRQTLVLNAMAYMSKFAPPYRGGVLYRIHDAKGVLVEPGQEVRIKPFRTFLSWSETPTISVEGTDDLEKEILLAINGSKAKVIFSTKTALAFTPKPISDKRLQGLVKSVKEMVDQAARFASEREVVVYHDKPFTAKVVRAIDRQKELAAFIKELGVSKLLLGRINQIPTIISYAYPEQNRKLIQKLITQHIGKPLDFGTYPRWVTKTFMVRLTPEIFEVERLKK